jgi:hypothetical protein
LDVPGAADSACAAADSHPCCAEAQHPTDEEDARVMRFARSAVKHTIRGFRAPLSPPLADSVRRHTADCRAALPAIADPKARWGESHFLSIQRRERQGDRAIGSGMRNAANGPADVQEPGFSRRGGRPIIALAHRAAELSIAAAGNPGDGRSRTGGSRRAGPVHPVAGWNGVGAALAILIRRYRHRWHPAEDRARHTALIRRGTMDPRLIEKRTRWKSSVWMPTC